MSARLVQIYLRPSARTPVKAVERATAVAGRGLEGDHAGGGKRQVTLLSREAWEAACRQLEVELDPGARRANLVVEGVDFVASRGRRLRIGAVEVEVAGETRPCGLMDDVHLGLKAALQPEWRGGVFAVILTGGEVAVGDPVEEVAAAAER